MEHLVSFARGPIEPTPPAEQHFHFPPRRRMNLTQAEIEIALQKFITRHFPVARQHRVGLHDSLVGLGIVDSLGVLEIVTFIDKELGVALSDDDVMPETFESIVTIADLVCRHLAPEAAP